MGSGGSLLGLLTAEVNIKNLKALLGFLWRRLADQPIKITVKVKDQELKIEVRSPQEFLTAHEALMRLIEVEASAASYRSLENIPCNVTTRLETQEEVEAAKALVEENHIRGLFSKLLVKEYTRPSSKDFILPSKSISFDQESFAIGNQVNSAGKDLERRPFIQFRTPDKTLPPPKTLEPLVRYPNLDCPDQTIFNQKFSLFVQLLIKQPKPSTKAIHVEDTRGLDQLPEVEVVVRTPRGFDIEGSDSQIIQVKRDSDSYVEFILTPRQLGEQEVRVDFYQHDRRIDTVRCNVQVVNKPINTNESQILKKATSIELKMAPLVPPPDLELCVELRDNCTLYFTLHSKIAGYHHTKVGQVTLKGSPLEKMQVVYQEMNRLAAPVKQTERATAERRLSTLGYELWDELIPEKLKQEYWRLKSRVKSILITSDEPWVPWEMMKPYRYNDKGERLDEPFWCQQFALSRWLSGEGGTADELLVGVARSVAPTQVNLLSVQEEVAFIKQLCDLRSGITVLDPLNAYLELLDWLESGNFSMLHFACHGMFDATSPDNSAIKLSDGILRPSDIKIRFGGRRPRPLLFINACHGARTEFSFTGLGGWAKRLVMEAQVGAFIGAMWEVNDGLALRFARRFYTGLLKENETIAEAFRQAREEIRQLAPYNSTWLAYTLYADPEARLKDATATVDTEPDLVVLRKMLVNLREQIEASAPPAKKEAALERIEELEEAITAQEPDLSTMEYVKNWFVKKLPQLAGSVTSAIVHPIVGKRVAAAGTVLAADFQNRFGTE